MAAYHDDGGPQDEDGFFTDSTPPAFLPAHRAAARAFIAAARQAHRRIALVTSGGTTVPLENQTVRFMDNFSAGTRGAASAEYLLDAGYAVIFFHRKFSLLPYARHDAHASTCFLDLLAEDATGRVAVRDADQARLRRLLRRWNDVKANRLLLLSFVTVSDYLWALRDLATLLQPVGADALLYLAAAVSDFFIPRGRLAEHKIQSNNPAGAGGHGEAPGEQLTVALDPVPKFLKRLVDGWAPTAMVVSFKLETDPDLLLDKARRALERYAHQLVIGNLLATRTWEVVFVTPGAKERWIRIQTSQLVKELLGATRSAAAPKSGDKPAEASPEIEALIIPEVVKLHEQHIAAMAAK